MGIYRLAKAKKILLHTYHRFLRKRKVLSQNAQEQLQSSLQSLEKEILAKNRLAASERAHQLQSLAKIHLKKGSFEQIRDFVLGLGVALAIAVVVRLSWFELYEIPTGSMRPTFKEQDRLSVSKTSFGVNVPLTTDHLYFNPSLIDRANIVIFTVQNMDFQNPDTIYFYVFPGKKQLVKRLIGKPGDTLYFYGGQVYGIDAEGKDISSTINLPELSLIDHIPFFNFENRITTTPSPQQGIFSPVILSHFNEPIARLWVNQLSQVRGELLPKITHGDPSIRYGQLWGMDNFAMARLLTKEQVRLYTDQDPSTLEEGVLYLELRHHPSLETAHLVCDEWNRVRPTVGVSTSIIPLQEDQLKKLFSNLYTSRFVVKNGLAWRYGIDPKRYGNASLFPHLPGIPDGTYEFYYGKGSGVHFEGITTELASSHPLLRFDVSRLQLLFNTGMEFDTRFSPQSKDQTFMPARYAYYRDGDLYVMGLPLLTKDDPLLQSFIEREARRSVSFQGQKVYTPFIDGGPPSTETIQRLGLKIPEKSYLVLGDNHANSGDSREFGFVPEDNMRGGPSFIFWPPGSRFGLPLQPGYPLFNPGRIAVWILATICFGTWYVIHRKRSRLPLEF
ncbi:MAG: signal peptidase I [Verrucomicrobia bacterium]|nr:signal peptidase I [Verrucomicrobiota bacterium]